VSGGTWIGLDRGDGDVAAAEHLAAEFAEANGLDVAAACTHLVRAPHGHVAASLAIEGELSAGARAALLAHAVAHEIAVSIDGDELEFAGPDAFLVGALDAGAAHHDATSGRAFRFPGERELRGRLKVVDLLARSAIDRVEDLTGPVVAETEVETRDHVRPVYRGGVLTLITTPRADGSVQPFESPTPHDCCGGH
jgi:hypothetical protein